MFLKLLITVYFLVMAFLYIIVYGSIVLLISVFISMTKGKERSKEFVYNEIAKFGRRAFTWMFSRVTIQGSENFQKSESYLVVANHQSLMDIPLVLGYLKPMPLVAKKELAKVPGISWFVKYMGGVFLDRKKTSEGAAVLRDIMKKLKELEAQKKEMEAAVLNREIEDLERILEQARREGNQREIEEIEKRLKELREMRENPKEKKEEAEQQEP